MYGPKCAPRSPPELPTTAHESGVEDKTSAECRGHDFGTPCGPRRRLPLGPERLSCSSRGRSAAREPSRASPSRPGQ
eukprot:scaffold58041_cov75-Phaeocystis_antarctica.AAC.1